MKYDHVILGGSGHIGTALVKHLKGKHQSVLTIGHDPAKAEIDYAVANIMDTGHLRELFSKGERVFILNPPAPPDSDTDTVERQQIKSILDALNGLKIKKIVAASAYGAQKNDHLFDLGTLYDLEEGVSKLPVPVAIIRSAYYMSNLDQVIPVVKEKGELMTLFPPDFKLPMVAPEDIGQFAASLLMDDRTGLFFVEGPEAYTYNDAAMALGELFHQIVKVVEIPESGWKEFLIKGGFSEKAAASFVNMARKTISELFIASDPVHGPTTLHQYLKKLEQDIP